MTDHATVMHAHTQIDALIEKLERVCFDPKAAVDATQSARIRRRQLIDVKELLLGRQTSLKDS